MKYSEIKNLVYWVSDSSEAYNQNKDFTMLIAWKKTRDVKLFFYNKIIPNPDKPEPKKRKLKAHPDASGQRRKEYAKVFLCDPFAPSRLCVKSLLFGI